MALIDNIDGANRLIYLGVDSTSGDVHPIDIYKEMRALRRTDETLRKYNLFLSASGNVPKSTGKYTERYVTELDGTRIIPYDLTHVLNITGTIITDDGQEGVDCFDRTSLTAGVEVDINYIPPQVEVIEVSTGGISEQDKTDIVVGVWTEQTSSNKVSGSFGEAMGIIKKVVNWLRDLL